MKGFEGIRIIRSGDVPNQKAPTKPPIVILPKRPMPMEVESPTSMGFSKAGFTGSNRAVVSEQIQRFKDAKLEDEDDTDLETIYVDKYRNLDRTVNPEIVRVWIKGKEPNDIQDTTAFFTGKFLKGRLEYRADYPQNPPTFYFQKLKNNRFFESMNVYGDGSACQFTLNPKNWAKNKYDLKGILKSIQDILYVPNESDAADADLADIFASNQAAYWQNQRNQAQYFYTQQDMLAQFSQQ